MHILKWENENELQNVTNRRINHHNSRLVNAINNKIDKMLCYYDTLLFEYSLDVHKLKFSKIKNWISVSNSQQSGKEKRKTHLDSCAIILLRQFSTTEL